MAHLKMWECGAPQRSSSLPLHSWFCRILCNEKPDLFYSVRLLNVLANDVTDVQIALLLCAEDAYVKTHQNTELKT